MKIVSSYDIMIARMIPLHNSRLAFKNNEPDSGNASNFSAAAHTALRRCSIYGCIDLLRPFSFQAMRKRL